jgi:ADP-ribose pyrophosphatase YjhB (NUDIX family)
MDYLSWLRGKVGHSLVPLVYGTGIVRDSQDRILFQQRGDFGCWGLPGGVLEPGESPSACVRREVSEETGLRVEPLRLTAVLSHPRHNVTYPNGDLVQQVTFFFECAISGGRLRAGMPETSALSFFPPESAPPTLPWYRLALDHMQQPRPYFDPPDPATAAHLSAEPTWSILRRRTGPDPLTLPGASAVIRDPDGGLLLVRRMDSGLWILPGGLMELGESLSDSVVRETREETGLEVVPLRVCGAFGGHRVVYPGGDVLFPIATWFECTVSSGTLAADGIEVDQAEYFPTNRLPPLVYGLEERLRKALDPPDAAVFP